MYDRLQTLLSILIISYLCVACQSQKIIKPVSEQNFQLNPETVAVTSPIVRQTIDNAIAQTKITNSYDPAYVAIPYPGGDFI